MPKQTQFRSDAELASSLSKQLTQTLQDANKNLNEDSPQGALSRGIVFQLAGYFLEAAESYASAAANNGDMKEAGARQIVAQLKARQFEKGLASAMAFAAEDPNFELKELTSNQVASALTLLGDALAHNDRASDAIEAYKLARTSSKRDAFAAGRLAQLYLATGEPKKAVELTKDVAANPRFRSLSRLLNLGAKSAQLLPAFQRGSISSLIAVTDHGRPLFVEGTPRSASLTWGNDQWCADVTGESSD